jgi:hypothetical protein
MSAAVFKAISTASLAAVTAPLTSYIAPSDALGDTQGKVQPVPALSRAKAGAVPALWLGVMIMTLQTDVGATMLTAIVVGILPEDHRTLTRVTESVTQRDFIHARGRGGVSDCDSADCGARESACRVGVTIYSADNAGSVSGTVRIKIGSDELHNGPGQSWRGSMQPCL